MKAGGVIGDTLPREENESMRSSTFFRQMSSGPEKRIRDKLIQSLIYLDFINFFGLLSTWTWVLFSEATATTKTHSGFSNVW